MSSSGNDPKLPHDVVQEILKRLPVVSLLRFRCVSRSWRSAIDNRRFVALHMNHAALDPSNWHTLCLDGRGPLQRVFSLDSESQLQLPFATPPNYYGFDGSCNGLICVIGFSDGYGFRMYLWNSFTRNHKVVPRSGLENQSVSVENARLAVGFGFDARSHDYKIVRVFYVPVDSRRCSGGTNARVEIYSLRKDSWRSLGCEVPAIPSTHPAVFLNGNLHWFSSKFDDPLEEGGYGSVVSFDVAGEVFNKMALPEEISHPDTVHSIKSLAVLNDLLAVFISFIDLLVVDPEPHSVCSVWVMREYGVPESWTKLYTFKACGEVTRFDGFTMNGELLMEIFPGKGVSQNPITGQYTKLPLWASCNWVTVVESLVHFRDDSIAATFTGDAD